MTEHPALGPATTVVHSVRLLTAGQDRTDAFVAFSEGRVLATGTGPDWQACAGEVTELVDGAGHLFTPGLIDIHNHGGGGASYDHGPDAIRTAVGLHRQHGTTRQLLSFVTASPDDLVDQITAAVPEIRRDPAILGLHLEGPFLSPEHRGAHDPALLADPDPAVVERLLAAADGTLRQITLAPERTHFVESAQLLREAGVVVAVGHTDASFEQTQAAIEAGATLLTHTFNAMLGIHHRAPGPVVAFVENPDVWLELINDGVHVRPQVARLLYRLVPGRVVLVTDAMAAAGGADGRYRLGQLDVDVRDGTARLAGGTSIAGSTLTLDVAVANAVREVGVTPLAAVEAATVVPAQVLGLADRYGRLEPGYPADAVLFDDAWQVQAVWIDGRRLDPP